MAAQPENQNQVQPIGRITRKIMELSFKTTNLQEHLENLYKDKVYGSGPCRKQIAGIKGYCYRCLDCQVNPSSIICQECYDNSNHEGHRVFKEEPEGVCDCGDPLTWNLSGNCQEHTGFVKTDNVIDSQTNEEIKCNIQKGFLSLIARLEAPLVAYQINIILVQLLNDLV